MGTPWTMEEAATARRMAADGHGFPAIAEALGRSRKSVQSWAHANGVSTGKGQPWTAAECIRARALYRAGNTCGEVARILGRSERSVGNRLWKDGVTQRERSGSYSTTMHATRYALALEGLTAAEIIAVLGLTCAPVSLRSWMARYCESARLKRPWHRGMRAGSGGRIREDVVAAKRQALGLTGERASR